MHVEGLLPANLCLVTFLSSEQCNFRLQNVQMVNKTSAFKTFIGNNAVACSVNHSTI